MSQHQRYVIFRRELDHEEGKQEVLKLQISRMERELEWLTSSLGQSEQTSAELRDAMREILNTEEIAV